MLNSRTSRLIISHRICIWADGPLKASLQRYLWTMLENLRFRQFSRMHAAGGNPIHPASTYSICPIRVLAKDPKQKSRWPFEQPLKLNNG